MKALLWTPSPIAPCNNLYPIYFLLLGTSFVYIKSFSHYYRHWMMLLVLLLMMRFFSVFSWSWIHITLIRSHHPFKRRWSWINVLHTTATLLKLLVFKWFLKELLLETKLSEVKLIWRFVSIKLTRPFLKFSFLICFFKWFRL